AKQTNLEHVPIPWERQRALPLDAPNERPRALSGPDSAGTRRWVKSRFLFSFFLNLSSFRGTAPGQGGPVWAERGAAFLATRCCFSQPRIFLTARASRSRPIALLIVCGVILIAALAAGTGALVSMMRTSILDDNERDLSNIALILAQQSADA